MIRAKRGEDLCPVCWLVAELAREHKAGEHNDPEHPNASCVDCMRPLRASRTRKEARRLIEAAVPYAGHGELYRELQAASESRDVMDSAAAFRAQSFVVTPRVGAHADCDHEATKAARAKCRAERARRT